MAQRPGDKVPQRYACQIKLLQFGPEAKDVILRYTTSCNQEYSLPVLSPVG